MSEQTGAVDAIEQLLARARDRLDEAPQERLGELRQPRRILGIARSPRIVPAGSAWPLGVLLLTQDAVLATGEVVRARTEAVRGYTAESQRARAGLAHAASRGGFADGETVHVGWVRLDPRDLRADTVPLAVQEGLPVVRWSAAGGYLPLSRYLDERIDLLRSPPERA
ncbi:glutaminase [Microbacterium lushaniae]|uniref:Glutaminase n=1 Tax=Microbacterium lushaniae TaxID=2614639 RepID=A0A5J6L0K3_9MICO|nr:glutaminase [Microbacterium lushaniae]QEW02009.1 glutaminase [Microbacterium lushaniae]